MRAQARRLALVRRVLLWMLVKAGNGASGIDFWFGNDARDEPEPPPEPPTWAAPEAPVAEPGGGIAAARGAIQQTRSVGGPAGDEPLEPGSDPDAAVDRDDPDDESPGLTGQPRKLT